jgi:hypothetical protein
MLTMSLCGSYNSQINSISTYKIIEFCLCRRNIAFCGVRPKISKGGNLYFSNKLKEELFICENKAIPVTGRGGPFEA